ncbi:MULTISPECIES: carbohydrate ABC transporter permease [unclassified Oceanispirochaeta]|uniref:carbohydrate ABC transporter permease n=1 Tax=unclassified Oceanispirochaeta TaxID=2635722 RepID=UPI000E0968E0|nr:MULTISPECIES: sugar ABC transporter permease [unclassified Oceanispirochaeta]MBF9017985.1 sugar ABC transporter permease [Oceanispirochaeta sp. M2]NPD74497.1 sugar ABC transporter permease [Oceanispirochaeta sp. M1]RDG29610.1 sugar ABC transporter permease [Oceanispirochaeta sp. M1]
MNQRKTWGYIAPTLLLITLLVYIPVLKGIIIAFQNYNMFNIMDIHFNGFQNYKDIINDRAFPFMEVLYNTFTWVFVSLALQFVLGFSLALLLRKPFKGRGVYTSLVFYTWAVSGFAIGLIWSWMFNGQFGLINDLLMRFHLIKTPIGFLSDPRYAMISVIIANVWYGIPFFGIMLLAALQSVPAELYEAARMDGAGPWSQLFNVTIPFISATIISTTLLRMMWIMNFPEIIYGMTNGGPANSTNILATYMINKIYKEFNYGQGAAIGVMIMVILLICTTTYLSMTNKKELEL